jgi:type IV secretory pathway TraG/TraD family ATPase VirD4
MQAERSSTGKSRRAFSRLNTSCKPGREDSAMVFFLMINENEVRVKPLLASISTVTGCRKVMLAETTTAVLI